MKLRALVILVVIGLLAAMSAQAWSEQKNQDSGKAAATRRYHLSIPDKETEKELLGLLKSRRFLVEDVRVLTRLIQDRKKRFESLGKSLKEVAEPVYNELINATADGNWVDYVWKEKQKHTYVRKTKGGLIVGSGYSE